jgi:hypothetical protein
VSKANYKAPWVYAVVTFLHKDVFKRPIRVDWAGQYTRITMKHMLRESVVYEKFIGTQFSILYTSMYSQAEAATSRA